MNTGTASFYYWGNTVPVTGIAQGSFSDEPGLAVTSVTVPPAALAGVDAGTPVTLSAIVANNGLGPISTCTVTFKAGITIVGVVSTANLAQGATATVSTIWTTAGWYGGSYPIVATVELPATETDLSDNSLT